MTYTRINPDTGVREFSTCKTIKLIYDHEGMVAGQWVSNPSAELIASEDWEEYIPPVIPPAPQTEPSEDAKVTALNKMLASQVVALDDESALQVIALFPTWISMLGKEVHTGERYYYNEALWKVLQSHTTQESWTPDASPSLFVKVSIEEWPEWVRPISTETAYNTGDKVTFESQHYISAIDGNVWSPTEYPQGWSLVN